ncbi:penicillin-binding transpeptidase domain-containing protein [Patescibacteria group bacterium]
MKTRTFSFLLITILGFLILWSKLFWLQVAKGEENKKLAEENRIKVINTPALRGVIYDTKENTLARNKPEGREYVYGEVLAHVLGYVGEVSEGEILENDKLKLGDIVGKIGLEKQYDALIRGKDGGILVETDAEGNVVREIKKIEPETGENINLSLDLELQKQAFLSLKQKKGAVVASNPKTGAILILASSPSFDPNVFSQKINEENEIKIERVLENLDNPMFNRAISGLYPPASTFKIITAIAGLEEGSINSTTEVEDTGVLKVGDFSYGNWYFSQYGKTEGLVDIVKAIKRSNDIFFYKTGEWLGITKLSEWASFFGVGRITDLDIPGEAVGLMPTPDWKKQKKLESWYLGDTYITAIGQGNLQLTPLQVNQMTSVIAANGKLCQPFLLKNSEIKCLDLNISQSSLSLVKEGLKQACETGGTGWPFFDFKPQVGCKTGTAEFGDPQDKTHAWFTVFAPWDDPEIVVTVLLEAAGEGSYEAAPVAKEILKYYFSNKN